MLSTNRPAFFRTKCGDCVRIRRVIVLQSNGRYIHLPNLQIGIEEKKNL